MKTYDLEYDLQDVVEVELNNIELLGPITEGYQKAIDIIANANFAEESINTCAHIIDDFEQVHKCLELTDKLWEIFKLKFFYDSIKPEHYLKGVSIIEVPEEQCPAPEPIIIWNELLWAKD